MENKKTKIISIASLIALALTLVTATFAYFMAQTGEGKSTDIKINANTVDTFTFETGGEISLNLNQDNFASGAGNQTGTTFAKAMLTANNKTNTATEHYNLILNISNNGFGYTLDENEVGKLYPEILLTIKDESNNEITSVTGLTYKTVTDGKGESISGFDVTTKTGLFTLLSNREITTTSSTTDTWSITLTFINYDADQSLNAGRSMSAKVMIQKAGLTDIEVINTKVSYQKGDYYDLTINVKSTEKFGTASKYYYSKDGGETYEESTSGSHTFSKLEPSTTYPIAVYATDANNNKSEVYKISSTIPEKAIVLTTTSKLEQIEEGVDLVDVCVITFEYTSKNKMNPIGAVPSTIVEYNGNKSVYYIYRNDILDGTLTAYLSIGDVDENGYSRMTINRNCEITEFPH